MEKIKVVWISPFNISKFDSELQLKNAKATFCPWIDMLLDELKDNEALDLHLIAYSTALTRKVELKKDNIQYYFLPHGIPLTSKGFPYYLQIDFLTKFLFLSKKIKKTIDSIKPDFIHLHGTENPYSISVIKLNYPTLISIQGFALKVYEKSPTWMMKIRKDNELKIIKNKNHFIVRSDYMKKTIQDINPAANFYFNHYPTPSLNSLPAGNKKDADIVFAARLVKDKGIEDLIDSCKIVKEKYPQLLVKIIGRGSKSYVSFIKQKIKENGLNSNFRFIGFLPTQEGVLLEELSSKICVLPTYYDNSPGTIRECLMLGVPVVSYKVDDIPELVQHDKTGLLVDVGDIEGLANSIIDLLTNDKKRTSMEIAAKAYAAKYLDNKNIAKNLVEIYKDFLQKHNS